MKKRYSNRDFPAYAHRLGVTPHPKKAGGHSEGKPEPVSYAITGENWSVHEDYLFAVDLFNAAYYWEAHVWWEAIWHATSNEPDKAFIQGLIKLAAANLKLITGEQEIAYSHAKRGHELMSKSFGENVQSNFGVSRIWWNNILKSTPRTLELIE